MTVVNSDGRKTLIADEGKYLFNGVTYGTTVKLPVGADESVWREVTEEDLPKVDEQAVANFN